MLKLIARKDPIQKRRSSCRFNRSGRSLTSSSLGVVRLHKDSEGFGIHDTSARAQPFDRLSSEGGTLGIIQPELHISKPGDPGEREADRVADEVMQRSDDLSVRVSDGQASLAKPPAVQRACNCGGQLRSEETVEVSRSTGVSRPTVRERAPLGQIARNPFAGSEPIEDITAMVNIGSEEDEAIAAQRNPVSTVVPGATARPEPACGLAASIHSASRRGGQPLPRHARQFMEGRFGHDFGAVRVHADRAAGDLAHQLQARAFTTGNRIFFAPGEFQPDQTSGKRLLAHELAHVLQQAGDSQEVQRQGPAAGHPCPVYDGYDTSRAVESYNCLGLALRTYDYKPLAEARNALADRFPFGQSAACSEPCAPGQIKMWFWEYSQRLEDEDGRRSGLRDQDGNVVPSEPWRDYHTVAGAVDQFGGDPQDVYSKDGRRPIYGPGTGPAFRPPDRQPATRNNRFEIPGFTSDGKRLFWIRSDRLDECYCGSPCPSP